MHSVLRFKAACQSYEQVPYSGGAFGVHGPKHQLGIRKEPLKLGAEL